MALQDDAGSLQNDAGTGKQIDTDLTQPRSLSDLIPGMMKLRFRHGAKSEIGGHASNFLEAWDNYQTETVPSARAHLRRTMAASVAMIGALVQRLQ